VTYVNVGQTPPLASRAIFDFDGDGTSDLSIYRPSTGTWWYAASSEGGTHRAIRWGLPTDQVAAGDFDGDGKTDPAVFRNGDWYILASTEGKMAFHFGLAGDIPQVGDYDGDGRADLCVGQNSAETKLYHNETARPGLRVRLSGANGNASAAGAVLRLIFADGKRGPAREIHLGSGWMSQDSVVQVLATPELPKALWVRWAGGRETETPIAPNTREVVVDFTGQSTGR